MNRTQRPRVVLLFVLFAVAMVGLYLRISHNAESFEMQDQRLRAIESTLSGVEQKVDSLSREIHTTNRVLTGMSLSGE